MSEFEAVVGLEVHVELKTATKLFCGCSTAFGAQPNTQVCPVCAGLPGALPEINSRVVELGIVAGLALGCSISEITGFDRKHYFYPDQPNGYQITQINSPICKRGALKTSTGTVRISDIHMEDDAGKLIHSGDSTLVDYNRAGVPLLEIVTAPDIRSAEQAVEFLTALREILLFLGVSDCRMQEGSLRADVNLSVRLVGSRELGVRTEMKNLSSFRAVRDAINCETARQIEVISSGGKVLQQTRRWQQEKGSSAVLREKRPDYRYLPAPDLPKIKIGRELVENIRSGLTELPIDKRKRYEKEHGLKERDTVLLTSAPQIARLFEKAVELGGNAKIVANIITGDMLRMMRETATAAEEINVSPESITSISKLIENGSINHIVAHEVFEAVFNNGADPREYVEAKGLLMLRDSSAIDKAVEEIMAQNPKAVAQYRDGTEKAFGFLMGRVMGALGGKADPKTVGESLSAALKSGCTN